MKIVRRSARQSLQRHDDLLHKTLKNSVLGVNQEDLHKNHDGNEELDCQRSAPQKGNNSVLEENQEDLQFFHTQRSARQECLITSMRDTTFGASTNSSADSGTERTVRGQRVGVDILGTSITCSGTRTSKAASNTNGWSTICGTGTSRAGNPSTASTIWSTVRRRSLSCGLTSESRSGRAPPGSSYRLKSSGWVGGSRIVAV